ncbi:cilium assembly protein DZIP1L isoform X1 [Alosa pseudoharengus]|uniref:cilium assembly protein DZIP1L isoform X1 n=2 Tax=Alosa pseudoharengus TaxID=34774 RepID=UPI003F88AC2B
MKSLYHSLKHLYTGIGYPVSLFPLKRIAMPGQLSSSEPPLSGLLPSPTWVPGPVHPFHFRVRTEPVDWRRIGALDVDRVGREMDIGLLQEHVTGVTFCDVSGERCPHCRGSVDPALVKVLRMSQLSTEYLLHCQDYLSAQLGSLEERLQGALSAAEREAEEKAKLDTELQAERLESKRRKKMITTQQLLLQAASNNYHKCQFCEKSFINYSYLQAHQQRRHPEATETEKQKKKQLEQVEDGIEELRERLRLSQAALDAEKEAVALRRNQELEEQRRREVSERQELDRWKEEERRKVYQEMAELKQLFLQEFKDINSKSSSIEAKLEVLQRKEVHSMPEIRVSRDEEDLERTEAREKELREKLVRQKSDWKKRVKELQNKHQLEKEELQRENERLLHLTTSEDQSSGLQRLQQQVNSLSSQLHSKDHLIRTQEDKIKKLSAKPAAAPAPPVRQDALESSEEVEEEEEEEEEDDELEQLEARRQHRESLKKNPDMLREFRPILQDNMEARLERMGLKKGTKGISKQTLKSLTSLLAGQRQQKARQDPNLQSMRERVQAEVNRRLRLAQKSQSMTITRATTQSQKVKVAAGRSKEKSAKPKQTTVKSVPKRGKSPAPQPTPRSKLLMTPHTKVKKSSTPPFSSEEESIGDSAYITSPSKPTPSVRLVQSGPQQNLPQGPSSAPTDDWSDSDLSEEVAGTSTQQGLSTQGSVVQTLTRSLERQLTSPMSKPVGGIRVIPPATKATTQSKSVVKKLQLSDEDSDLELSSIEEVSAEPVGVRRSSDIGGTSGTSVWSSSTSRPGGWANP